MHQQVCKDFLPKLAEALKSKEDVCYKAGATIILPKTHVGAKSGLK